MKNYKWDAQEYEKHSQGQQKWARELIEKISLNGTENVLDLGCGDGKVTAEISKLVRKGSIIGIDNSAAMIKLATDRHSAAIYPNLSFKEMDAGNLKFDDRFDLIFSNAVLHWVKDQKPVIKGMFKSLKHGGRVLLQMGGKGNAAEIVEVLSELQTEKKWHTYFNGFDFPFYFPGKNEYEALLLDCGFTLNRIELIPKKMDHAGITALKGWIRTTWLPYTERVPEEKRERFIDIVSKKYIERYSANSNGIINVQMVRLEVEAEKK
tara:strand:+ start:366 stop:1160 length:795 start_codon:yes stop_codon:yes gene_type:complete